jgi:pimeloyl-ACP methyl ester carboxylesterase
VTRGRRLTISSALAVLLITAVGTAAPTGAVALQPDGRGGLSRPVFHPAACPAHAFPDRLDVDCGYVRVPEDRSDPQGRQIKVAAAVVHATNPQPGAEPILLIPGGAGASAITRFSIRVYLSGTKWDDGHDVVLVDTRGVGKSTPNLGCPELDPVGTRSFYAGPYAGSRYPALLGKALRACRNRLESERISLESYTVREASADLEVLRRALDVDQWNLLAISADGVLGMSYLRFYPDSFRSVIVDSGMSPQMRGLLEYDYGYRADLEEIFAGCAANRACRRSYPHLRQLFMRTVARLQRHPVTVHLRNFRPHPERMRIDGVGLYFDATHSIFPGDVFAPEEIGYLIDNLWRMSHGQVERVYQEMLGTGPITGFPESRFFAQGRTMSLECHDTISAITPRVLRRAARDMPWYAPRYRSPAFDLGLTIGNPRSPAGCRIWDVGRASAEQHEPVVSDVPTLVLAGQFDGGVPDYIVQQNVEGLSRATYVEFPAVGHLQLAFFNPAHRCARSMAADFLADPTTPPDTTCVEEMPEFDFTPSSERADRNPSGAGSFWHRRGRL